MKKLNSLIALALLLAAPVSKADTTITQLPLGTAAATTSVDVFPFVTVSGVSITKKMKLWDLINLPIIISTFAPINNPVFTGVVTANTITSGSGHTLAIQTSGTTAILINASQNVGIGTTTPGIKLDVSGGVRVGSISNPTSGAGMELGWDSTESVIQSFSDRSTNTTAPILMSGSQLIFQINGSNKFHVASNGQLRNEFLTTAGPISSDSSGFITSAATLTPLHGGTGLDTSGSTGLAKVASGTWSVATLVNADVSGSAAIAYSKLNLTGSIVNADLAGSIAVNKLAALTASRLVASDGSGFLTAVANLNASGNTFTSTNTNGNIVLQPNGTGYSYMISSVPSTYPTLASGLAVGSNFSNTAGELDFFDVNQSATVSFAFYQQTGASAATKVFQLGSTGQPTFPFFATTGLVHSSSSGVLTSSLLVNADITASTIAASSLVLTDITSLSNLATVGTISSGTWAGTTLAVNHGGTGVTTSTGTGNTVLSASPTFTGTITAAAITASGLITPTGGVKGSTSNGNATAGNVGEYVEATITTATNFPGASNAWGNLTSISLTGGDWDVTLTVNFSLSTATGYLNVNFGIGTTSASNPGTVGVDYLVAAAPTATYNTFGALPSKRVTVSSGASPTTVYALENAGYSTGNPQYTCRLSARRVQPGS